MVLGFRTRLEKALGGGTLALEMPTLASMIGNDQATLGGHINVLWLIVSHHPT